MVHVGDERVAALARTVRPGPRFRWRRGTWSQRVLPANLTTQALARLRGTLEDGTAWSVFVKVLQPASDSPSWAEIPEVFHQQVLEDLDWQDEPRAYRCGLADVLPDGLRMPTLMGIDEGPSTVTLYLEEVADPWRLGRRPLQMHGLPARAPGRPVVRGRGRSGLLGATPTDGPALLRQDHPLRPGPDGGRCVLGRTRRRRRRRRPPSARPGPLGPSHAGAARRARDLSAWMAHGDAAPDNLLEPGDSVVAIDWSYASLAPLGSDLGQVVAGRVGDRDRTGNEWRELIATVGHAFAEGLADEGVTAEVGGVERALAVDMATRFVFSALLVDPNEHAAGRSHQAAAPPGGAGPRRDGPGPGRRTRDLTRSAASGQSGRPAASRRLRWLLDEGQPAIPTVRLPRARPVPAATRSGRPGAGREEEMTVDGPKITLIGAGGMSFGPAMVNDVVHTPALRGALLVLHDVNPERLQRAYQFAAKLNASAGAPVVLDPRPTQARRSTAPTS